MWTSSPRAFIPHFAHRGPLRTQGIEPGNTGQFLSRGAQRASTSLLHGIGWRGGGMGVIEFSSFRFILVIALFAGHILFLAPIFDRWRKRSAAKKANDPEQASLDAELLARRLGEMVLRGVHAVAWLSGLTVLGLLIAFVYDGWWLALPIAVATTLIGGAVANWTSEKLVALKDGLLSRLL
jgi:hypothetical protein